MLRHETLKQGADRSSDLNAVGVRRRHHGKWSSELNAKSVLTGTDILWRQDDVTFPAADGTSDVSRWLISIFWFIHTELWLISTSRLTCYQKAQRRVKCITIQGVHFFYKNLRNLLIFPKKVWDQFTYSCLIFKYYAYCMIKIMYE